MAYRFEPLSPEHDREDFACGEPALDAYLRERARKDVARAVAAVYVMVDESVPTKVMGYYSLSSFAIAFSDLRESILKKLPKYPLLPATLLGRLARDRFAPSARCSGPQPPADRRSGFHRSRGRGEERSGDRFLSQVWFCALGRKRRAPLSPDGHDRPIAPAARLIGLE